MANKREAGYATKGYRIRSVSPAAATTDDGAVTMVSGDDRLPSEVYDQYWIYAERSDGDSCPQHGDRGGQVDAFHQRL